MKLVRCAGCGDTFGISERNEYEHRRRGVPHRCRDCRRSAAPPPPAAYRGWWVERLGLEDARQVARMIWPATL